CKIDQSRHSLNVEIGEVTSRRAGARTEGRAGDDAARRELSRALENNPGMIIGRDDRGKFRILLLHARYVTARICRVSTQTTGKLAFPSALNSQRSSIQSNPRRPCGPRFTISQPPRTRPKRR